MIQQVSSSTIQRKSHTSDNLVAVVKEEMRKGTDRNTGGNTPPKMSQVPSSKTLQLFLSLLLWCASLHLGTGRGLSVVSEVRRLVDQRGTHFLRLILEVSGVWITETKGKSHFSPPSFAVYAVCVPGTHRYGTFTHGARKPQRASSSTALH